MEQDFSNDAGISEMAVHAHPFDTPAPSLNKTALDDQTILTGQYWGELRTFLALAKAKSLKQAAENLNISHMTVGRDIRRLQDLMGAQLVVLSKTGAALTVRGRNLARTLQRFDQTLFSLTNDLRSESRDAEGIVRISVTDGLGVIFVAPALRSFSAEFPKLQVHLKSPGNFKSLRENQTDLMIGFSPEPSSDVTSLRLGWLHFLPFASRDYISRKGLPTKDNLKQHSFIDTEIYSAQNGVWSEWRNLVASGRVAHFGDASITYGIMIKAGLGIGLLGNYNVLEPAAVPLDIGARISLPLYLNALTERLQSKPVQIVADFLERIFGESNPWFAKEMQLEVPNGQHTEGYSLLFNLGASEFGH